MNKTLSIFVPARLKSERLPNKQLLPLGDSCMFEICCRKLNCIAQLGIPTYVLIYDEPLVQIARKYPHVQVIMRDKATTETDGPLQFIYKDVRDIPTTHLMFLNPCLALLSVGTIMEAAQDFLSSGHNYGTSVKKFGNWLFDAQGVPQTPIDYTRLSTKEIHGLYQCAHGFHIFNKENFFADGLMLKPGHMLLEIPENETMDIDDKEDYRYAKHKWEEIAICD